MLNLKYSGSIRKMLNLRYFLYLTVITAFFTSSHIGSAWAVDLCVKVDTTTTKTSDSGNSVDWTVSYNGHKFYGIFVCSEKGLENSDNEEVDGHVSQYEGSDKNASVYCWCRLLAPLKTKWINYYYDGSDYTTNAGEFENITACESGCRDLCLRNAAKIIEKAQ